MRRKIKCCLGCEERNEDCHGICERYIRERAELDNKNAAMNKKKKKEQIAVSPEWGKKLTNRKFYRHT